MIDSVLNKFDHATDWVTERTLIPGVKIGYQVVGSLTENFFGIFSQSMAKWISKVRRDPFSSEFSLFFTTRVELLSASLAERRPVQNRCFHYFDQSLISCGQHLNAYVKELNYLLRLPEYIKGFASLFSFEQFFIQLAKACGEDLDWVMGILIRVKQGLLLVVGKVFNLADRFFRRFSFGYQLEVFGYLGAIIHDARVGVRTRFADIAIRTIERRERVVRREVMAAVADVVLDTTAKAVVNLGAKTLFGLGVYFLAKKAMHSSFTSSVDLVDITAAVGLFAILCKSFKPTVDGYYKAYNVEYNPHRSHLRAFCQKHDMDIMAPLLAGFQAFERADETRKADQIQAPPPVPEEEEVEFVG